ncbi:MAG: hypothetical protein AB7N80_03345 [Bdellovibrionales bacterium]
MKNLILIIALVAPYASAATKVKAPSKLRTDIRFNGTEVGGKYQSAGEAVTTVENEKPLIDLIEPRREFKDRLRKSVSQR